MFRKYLLTLPRTTVTEAVSSLYGVLLEASEGEAGKYFRKIVRSADPSVIQHLHDMTVEVMEDDRPDEPEENWIDWLWNWFRQDFGLRNNETVYFAPGLARIVLCQPDSNTVFGYRPLEMLSRNTDMIKNIVHYITMAHKEDYTRYLVDKGTGKPATFEELVTKFGAAVKQHGEQLMSNLNNIEYTPSDYVIVELKDFETAHKFVDYTDLGDYTDDSTKVWCYLDHENTYNYYRQDGRIRCYLAYKPGFENLEPGDEGYGQSMLGIDIGPNNQLVNCNNRYNHADDPELDNKENPPGDKRFNAKELSILLGGPYYKFCPYYTREERKQLGIITIDDIDELIQQGASIQDFVTVRNQLANGDLIVEADRHLNILRPNNTLLFKQWPVNIQLTEIKGSPAYVVKCNDEYNIFDSDGNQLLDEWYWSIIYTKVNEKYCLKFTRQDRTCNIMDLKDGSFEFHNWYKVLPKQIREGVFAATMSDGKIHFFDSNEEPISDLAVDKIWDWSVREKTYVKVYLNNKYNVIDPYEAQPLLDPWCDDIGNGLSGYRLGGYRLALIKHDSRNLYNVIDSSHPDHYLLDKWADQITPIYEESGKDVHTDYIELAYKSDSDNTLKYTLYDVVNRKYLFDFLCDRIRISEKYDESKKRSEYYIELLRDGKHMRTDLNGNPKFKHWVDEYRENYLHNGYWLTKDKKRNFMRNDYSYALEEWYDDVHQGIVSGDFIVTNKKDGSTESNVLRDNKPLFDKWPINIYTTEATPTYHKYYVLQYANGLTNIADENGNILFEQPFSGELRKFYNSKFVDVGDDTGYKHTLYANGKRVLDRWFEINASGDSDSLEITNMYAVVRIDQKYNVMRPNGHWLFDTWYDFCAPISEKSLQFVVGIQNKYNVWIHDHIEFDHWFNNAKLSNYRWHEYILFDDDQSGIELGVSSSDKLWYRPIENKATNRMPA